MPPSETTIRRMLRDTDPEALDEQLCAWTVTISAVPGGGDDQKESEAVQVMVNGKSLRGAVQADGRAVHLAAAMTGAGAVTMRQWPFRTGTTCAQAGTWRG